MEQEEKKVLFQKMLEEEGDRLLRLCTLYLKDRNLAEDAVQESFLRAFQHMDEFRGQAAMATWLTRIAINVCKGYLRSPWHWRRLPAQVLEQLPAPGMPETDDTLPRAVMALSRPYREVILLYYYQQLKGREIAEILHVPLSTVTVRLSRARRQLKEQLKGWYYDEE